MAIIVPNTGSVLDSDACVVGSTDRWAWIGISTPLSSSGCVVWFRAGSVVAGSQLLPLNASPGTVDIYGPFNSPNGLYAASITGGCAIVWLKQPST